MAAKQLKECKRKRENIIQTLNRFLTFISSEDDHKNDLIKIQVKLEHIETLFEKFDETQTKLEMLEVENAEPDDATNEERIGFEENYYEAVSMAKKLIARLTPTVTSSSNHSNLGSCMPNVKLPTLNLPSFDGAYDQWLSFHDMFNSIIHESTTLSEIQKFHYLRASLKTEAAQVIAALEVSASNYAIAWNLLKDRFQNKRLIVHNHIKALFDLSTITKESAVNLRQLLDNAQKHLRALKSLGQPTEHWDTLIIYLINIKLDNVTKREWESSIVNNDSPTVSDIIKFLNGRCHLLETLDLNKQTVISKSSDTSTHTNKFSNHKTKPQSSSHSYVAHSSKMVCEFCKAGHTIYKCNAFLKLPVKTRLEEIQTRNCCINCLRSNHELSECKAQPCRLCGSKHNTLVHTDNRLAESSNEIRNAIVSHCVNKSTAFTLLPTAIVYAYDKNGGAHECRVLLDSGSQANFIATEFCEKLKLHLTLFDLSIRGISQSSTAVTHKTEVQIKSQYNNFNKLVNCHVISKITDALPSVSFDAQDVNIPHNIKLADPKFNSSGYIDMLLGADVFWDLLCVGQIKLGNNRPILQKTHFGWIVSGKCLNFYKRCNQQCFLTINQRLENQLTRFWHLEDIKDASPFTNEELNCERHYQEYGIRDETGRFILALPFRDEVHRLGESRHLAVKRLHGMERKLQRQPSLKLEYEKFMRDYEELGHMSLINETESPADSYYLPHHAIVKPSSTTTKVRVVFDGSANTTSGISLNDTLMVGPTIQEDLFSIITRFRLHNYVLIGDIAKMYRQILIREDDRRFQRILWRTNPTEAIKCYELNTVTYGTASAPFLAIRCLHQLARDNELKYPAASKVLLRDFYVDDLISGGNTLDEVMSLKLSLIELLKTGGFELRKFMSNHEALLDTNDNPSLQLTSSHYELEVKTLGLLWNPGHDTFWYKYQQETCKKVTKRIILSETAKTFDPLGLIGPITLNAKLILQRLWQLNIGWDESVPLDLYHKWAHYQNDLAFIEKIHIPRQVICKDSREIQLHGFSDASEMAFGACVYLKSIDNKGNQHVNLLCSKSRVAPLKTICLPRLELSGALLLAQLCRKVLKSFNIKIDRLFYWCDSTITLAWIAASPSKWKTFVANRVAEIQELTNTVDWYYVNTKDNPADIISRGSLPGQLINNQLWWHGPDWLSLNSKFWPKVITTQKETKVSVDSERKIVNLTVTKDARSFDIFERYSSLIRLQRVTAYILRFYNKCSKNNIKNTGPLTVPELRIAFQYLIKVAQSQEFNLEIKLLKKGEPVSFSSKLTLLSPFLDTNGLIRVGGRLQNASISFNQKHPILLPKKHPLTTLIIWQEHISLLHAGPQATLASLRKNFWPLAARRVVKSILHKCVRCFRVKPKGTTYPMGNLPKNRLTPSRPFMQSGLDYAGPFYIKESRYRGRKLIKVYLCLFVCLSTKAVHLELVSDLTTDCFINALKRFIARRGKCSDIFSDNATTFCGANNKLKELASLLLNEDNNTSVIHFLSKDFIKWSFIPPKAPHFGGLWEAAIKSAKYHLKRILGNAHLTFEGLYTVLTQVEACMNSRPITPLSEDPNDLTSLTPGHFILGDSLTAVPDEDIREVPISRLSTYQRQQQLVQHFWARWSKEYLGQLQQKTKVQPQTLSLQEGMLVVIKDDNLPPLKWVMGRTVKIYPGDDGVVRVADIRTASGTVKRPVKKLCLLPIDYQ